MGGVWEGAGSEKSLPALLRQPVQPPKRLMKIIIASKTISPKGIIGSKVVDEDNSSPQPNSGQALPQKTAKNFAH